jgi:hypothetical protein
LLENNMSKRKSKVAISAGALLARIKALERASLLYRRAW